MGRHVDGGSAASTWRAWIVAAAVAAINSGCAGDLGPSLAEPAIGPPALATGNAPPKQRFNPFVEPGAEATGGREVMANPTVADVMQPGRLPEIAVGRADAPVTIIKYMSLTCPYCRRFQAEVFPVLKREYIDTGKVRFILREFPIGHQSGHATIALRCAGGGDPKRYLALYEKFMGQQASWVSQEVRLDPIFKVAAQVGMSRAEFDACFKDQATIEGLKAVKERGRYLGIIGTPNFFINGRLVKKVLTMGELREMIDPLAGGRGAPTAAAAAAVGK